jgi:hypothetical protein
VCSIIGMSTSFCMCEPIAGHESADSNASWSLVPVSVPRTAFEIKKSF